MCCAEAGMQVVLLDVSADALKSGMAAIKKNYARSVERKSKSQEQVDTILSKFKLTEDYADFANCDIVVEAVFENMKVKKEIFGKFDQHCKKGCILATNTSGLNIDEIASATKRPEDVIGCHFFSPANVMKLLENVRGSKSSPRTIASAMEFGKRCKKVTCLVGNCPGFVANRVMGKSGATFLLHSGVNYQDIDAASEGFGMKIGPFKMQDLVGLDLFGRERANSKTANPDKFVVDAMYAAERKGQKNGKGYYNYDAKRNGSPSPEAQELISKVVANLGNKPKSMSPDEIVKYLYFPVINESFRCLEEGIAIRPSDVDICCMHGYNWPKSTGGPMYYAGSVGLAKVKEILEAMGEKPAALLTECVEKGWDLESDGLKQRLSAVRSKL